jgi:hypothetical protein
MILGRIFFQLVPFEDFKLSHFNQQKKTLLIKKGQKRVFWKISKVIFTMLGMELRAEIDQAFILLQSF